MPYTEEQPTDGETVLFCSHVHLDEGELLTTHWFRFPEIVTFRRPDGLTGRTRWLFLCEVCFDASRGQPGPECVGGDGMWQGDAPVIKQHPH